MAKDDRGPKVPDGPTVTANNSASKPGDREPLLPPAAETPDEQRRAPAPPSDERRPGGRRPYEEILEENRLLAQRVQDLLPSVRLLATIPIDARAEPGKAQYALSKGGPPVLLTGAQVQAARTALGLPG